MRLKIERTPQNKFKVTEYKTFLGIVYYRKSSVFKDFNLAQREMKKFFSRNLK